MNRFLLSVVLGLMSLTFVAGAADAKRLGGGTTSGMKRQAPPPAQPAAPTQQTPAKQATAPANTAAAAAAAPKRSWLGPVAGLAAGLGLAALASHLGLGAEFGNVLTMLLLAAVAFFVIRWAMRRFGPQPAAPARGLQFAGAGAAAPSAGTAFGSGQTLPGSSSAPAFDGSVAPVPVSATASAVPAVPADFDTAGFERIAKLIFIRMQAANDAGNLDDLRQFSTPEMFANFRLDLQERGATGQQTDVVQLDAQVLEMAEEDKQQIVSVRFHGLIRETVDAPAEPFDEVWHLARPIDGSREWAIAGIAQRQ